MRNNKLLTLTLFFFSVISVSVSAQIQDVVTTSGESFEQDEGSVSWTLGEVAVHNYNESELSEGFQQVLLSVSSSTDNLPEGVKVYPNPVVQTLSVENNAQNYTLSLYDVAGNQLFITTCNNTVQVDFKKYKKGQYFLTLETREESYSFTILKN